MLSVLALFAGAVLTDAGTTHRLNTGFGVHNHLASPPRQVLIRSQLASPIGFNPNLQSLAFTNSFFPSPVFNSAPFRHEGITPFTSFHTSKFGPAPINYGATGHVPINYAAIGPATTTHISPHVVLKTASNYPSSFLSQGLFNSALISHIAPPQSAVLNSLQSNHAVIESGIINTHQIPNPSIQSYNGGYSANHVHVTKEVPEKSVSYSITENDYHCLKKHETEGQDSPYNPIPGFNTASPSEKLQHPNPHSHHGNTKDAPSRKSSTDNVTKRSPAPSPTPTPVPSPVPILAPSPASSESYERYVEPSFANVPEPLVFKHIYFHVPEPEFEEPLQVAPINSPPPKKTYNIVFIKAPVQEQQNSAYVQQVIQSRQPQIEDKTLIYVLSQKEDPVQLIPSIPPQKPSSPEVFFVKYQTKFENDITDHRNQVTEEHFPESISEYSQKRSLEENYKETTVD